VESGSREENASKQKPGVFRRFHETVKDSRIGGFRRKTSYELNIMRAEVESVVEDIKRSVGLLRRHL
jgi:hypothetical protein